jgi:hypothetical protein
MAQPEKSENTPLNNYEKTVVYIGPGRTVRLVNLRAGNDPVPEFSSVAFAISRDYQ